MSTRPSTSVALATHSGDLAETAGSDGQVLLAVKTPLMPRPVTAVVSGEATLEESVRAITGGPSPTDDDVRRVIEQLEREMSASAYHYLVVSPSGTVTNTPRTTALREIASPREVRTSKGLKSIPMVAVEVQAYAPVGSIR